MRWRGLWAAWWRARAAFSPRREAFPDFTLRDAGGREHTLSSGGPTVLWFTNLCEDCRARAPLLGEMTAAGLRVLAVSILPYEDPLPRDYARSAPFPVLLDPDDVVSRRLGLPHPPGACPLHNLFILDRSRRVLLRHHLSAVDPEALRRLWRRLL